MKTFRPQNNNLKPFKKGKSGNPAGRPKGARNKLGEMLLADLCELHEQVGLQAIQKVIAERPQDYLKVVVRLLPKEVQVPASKLKTMSDDELDEALERIDRLLSAGATSPDLSPNKRPGPRQPRKGRET
jgi:hypothetical protein